MDELQRFEQLVLQRAGLSLREQERGPLRKLLTARLGALGFKNLDEYLALLQSGSATGEAEWTQMFALLTNNETYFFRDNGQLNLLRDRILPSLIDTNRARRTLRLWSAGCSTGEEPYSLAMMVDELLGQERDWNVLIMGTDLSEAALAKARAGVYGAWSFRVMDDAQRDRYFSPLAKNVGKGFQLHERIRRSVTFQHNNLWHDAFPSPASALHDMDLILCRNVFIYFSRAAVAEVVEKFTRTLRPGGYLLTGHAELHNVPLRDLQTRTYPQTVIYQTTSATPTTSSTPIAPPSRPILLKAPLKPLPVAPAKAVAPPAVDRDKAGEGFAAAPKLAPENDFAAILRRSEQHLSAGDAAAALQGAMQVLEKSAEHYGALCLAAQAQANMGKHEMARELCRRAMKSAAFSPLAYQLMARIEEESGHVEAAKTLLKKVIYLAPSEVWSYLEMEMLYRREGDLVRAQTMRRSAFKILAALPPDTPIADPLAGESGGVAPTARDLLAQVQNAV